MPTSFDGLYTKKAFFKTNFHDLFVFFQNLA